MVFPANYFLQLLSVLVNCTDSLIIVTLVVVKLVISQLLILIIEENSPLALNFLVGFYHAALPTFGLAKLSYNCDIIQYYRGFACLCMLQKDRGDR